MDKEKFESYMKAAAGKEQWENNGPDLWEFYQSLSKLNTKDLLLFYERLQKENTAQLYVAQAVVSDRGYQNIEEMKAEVNQGLIVNEQRVDEKAPDNHIEEEIAAPPLNEHAETNGQEITGKIMAESNSYKELSYIETESVSVHCYLNVNEGNTSLEVKDAEGNLLCDPIPVKDANEAISYSGAFRVQAAEWSNQPDHTEKFTPNIEDVVMESASSKDCFAATVVYKDGPVTETVYVETPVFTTDDRGGTISQAAAEKVYRPDLKPEVLSINSHNTDNVTRIEDNAFQKFDTIRCANIMGNVEFLGKNSMPPNVEKVVVEDKCPLAADKDTLLAALKDAGISEKAEVVIARRDSDREQTTRVMRHVYPIETIRESTVNERPSKETPSPSKEPPISLD